MNEEDMDMGCEFKKQMSLKLKRLRNAMELQYVSPQILQAFHAVELEACRMADELINRGLPKGNDNA